MCSVFMIVGQIGTPKPPQMKFIERDDVIEQFAASTAHPSFDDSILPRVYRTQWTA
jgi:hypothetical protein